MNGSAKGLAWTRVSLDPGHAWTCLEKIQAFHGPPLPARHQLGLQGLPISLADRTGHDLAELPEPHAGFQSFHDTKADLGHLGSITKGEVNYAQPRSISTPVNPEILGEIIDSAIRLPLATLETRE